MAVDATNLIMGPGVLWVAPFGTTEPLDADVASDPGAGWEDVGGTNGGVRVAINQTYTELAVDQIVDPVGSRLTARVAMVSTSLAEMTMDNLARVLNNEEPTPDIGFTAFEPPNDNSATQPLYRALLFDGHAPDGLVRRVIVRKVLSVESVESSYSKDGQTLYPVSFKGHFVDSTTPPFKVIDETT